LVPSIVIEPQLSRRVVSLGLGCAAAFALAFASAIGQAAEGAATPASSPPAPPAQATPAQAAADYVGADTCLTCHSDKSTDGYSTSPHARAANPRTPAAAHGCETCHGPGKAHVDAGGTLDTIKRFPKGTGLTRDAGVVMAPREASATCATCHTRGEHAWWQGSAHDSRNLSCVTCHSVHDPKSARAQLKTTSVTATCQTCHRQQAMKLQRSAHMPVREGKMECSTCHNPHGSTNVKQLRVGQWVNESCVSCHTEKRGPFLFEHAAGREACSTCHDPHGASNDRMLVARTPMLCQRCHIGTRHPSTIYDATQFGNKNIRVIGRSCVSCHSNIHGSNHPAGNMFLR
jgi:DmsE family decaheme c-type cytochrome